MWRPPPLVSLQPLATSPCHARRYALLAIAASLSPQPLDENLINTLRDKYGDRMARMQSNKVDLSAYEELFAFACPKFISPVAPQYDTLPEGYIPQETFRLQQRLFMVCEHCVFRRHREPTRTAHTDTCTYPLSPLFRRSHSCPLRRLIARQGSTTGPTISCRVMNA